MPSATYEAVPEKRLLVACARTHMTGAAAQTIGEVARRPIDWKYLIQTAAENSVMPLLALQLPAVAGDSFSPEQLEQLQAAARAAGIRALQLSAELIHVVDGLRAAGIVALPYKGPVLAQQAYGDLALREFEDLDIVLPQRQITHANEVMIGLGYRPKYPWLLDASSLVPGEYDYFDESRRVIVELHTESTLRHFPVAPDLEQMSKSAARVAVGGHAVGTFSNEDTLVLLCIHGSKDFWERISWIADVAEFVQSVTPLDWALVLGRAERFKAQRMLFVGLALAASLLGAPLPDEIRTRIEADPLAEAIAADVEQRLLARKLRARSAAESFHYRRQMVPGAADSWEYALRLAMVPAEEDWMMVRLPRAMTPMYVALRPLRLFRKYKASR
ncbi:MAG TPA: nucleotidyltransferase family protein [Candidatus Acidoferrum sp.]|jgi:hypothetical protein|nr:nucleotidyltransferase family protein [Candidatus Acidoferrum sp.]